MEIGTKPIWAADASEENRTERSEAPREWDEAEQAQANPAGVGAKRAVNESEHESENENGTGNGNGHASENEIITATTTATENTKTKRLRAPQVIRGTGIGRGLAIAPLRFDGKKVGRSSVAALEKERLTAALALSDGELSVMAGQAAADVGEEHGEIYALYGQFMHSEAFLTSVHTAIDEGLDAGAAVKRVCEEKIEKYAAMTERSDRAKAAHWRAVGTLLGEAVENVGERDGERGAGRETRNPSGEKYILVTGGMEPVVLTRLAAEGDMVGLLCVGLSEGNDMVSAARAIGLPILLVEADDAPSGEYEGESAIIDPVRDRLTISPDLEALDRFAAGIKEADATEARLAEQIGRPSVTLSGRHVAIYATVTAYSRQEAERGSAEALAFDAEGLGCFQLILPVGSEESLYFEGFSAAVEGMKGRPVSLCLPVFPKAARQGKIFGEENPAMGVRGLREGLARREDFKRQLRAALRVAALGPVRLLLPTVSSVEEVRRAKVLLHEVKSELTAEKAVFEGNVPLGLLIEIPSAAILSEALMPEADFFVFSTDALLQYLLAADLKNPAVGELLRRNPEPMLRLCAHASGNFRSAAMGKQVGFLGSVVGDVSLTERFLSAGADFLSVDPPSVLLLREKIRACPL